MNVADLIRTTRPMVTATPGQSAATAAAMMKQHHVRHLPVLDQGKLVGLVSEHDLLRGLGELRVHPADVLLGDLMTEDLITVTPDDSLAGAIAVMNRRKVACLPVVSGGQLVGIVTLTDLLDYARRAAEDQNLRDVAAEYDADA